MTSLNRPNSKSYDLVNEDSLSEKDDLESFQINRPQQYIQRTLKSSLIPWLLTALFFSSTIFFLLQSQQRIQLGTFEAGFSTELAGSRSMIEIELRQFSGSPGFYEDGSEYIPENVDEPKYIGTPSDEIDAAWDTLTDGRYFRLTEEEAKDAWGSNYMEFWNEKSGGYLTGFDMFHTLHCLNHIRMSFYPDRYPQPPIHGMVHQAHCINHLRQMIMCNGDMTPIPTRWHPGIDGNYVDSDRLHTCRNFKKLRDWTTERFNGSLAVPPQYRGSL